MRALVLSGGGCKGAFQVGCLNHLLFDLGIQYDILCGVSVGALNSSFLSMFKIGQEKQAYSDLYTIWSTINDEKIYKNWFPFCRIHALWKSSFYDSSPLQKLIKEKLNLQTIRENRKISVGAVSLTSGKYKYFTQDDDDFINGVIASSSFPVMLKPIEIQNELYSDGGIKQITPIKEAIAMGADHIDIIICSPENSTTGFTKNPNSLNVLERTIDLMTDEILLKDISQVILYNKLVQAEMAPGKRKITFNILRPQQTLIENSLDFSHDKIMSMIDIGYNIAKENKWDL